MIKFMLKKKKSDGNYFYYMYVDGQVVDCISKLGKSDDDFAKRYFDTYVANYYEPKEVEVANREIDGQLVTLVKKQNLLIRCIDGGFTPSHAYHFKIRNNGEQVKDFCCIDPYLVEKTKEDALDYYLAYSPNIKADVSIEEEETLLFQTVK